MLGFANPLLDQEEDKAGGDEGHGEDDAEGHHHVGGNGGAANTTGKREAGVKKSARISQNDSGRRDTRNLATLTSKLAQKSGLLLNNRPHVFIYVLTLHPNHLGTARKRLSAVLAFTWLPAGQLAYESIRPRWGQQRVYPHRPDAISSH